MDSLVALGTLALAAAGLGVVVWRLRARSPGSTEAPASR